MSLRKDTQVILAFGPDATCTDPLDEAHLPRRHAEVIDDDVLVVWREAIGDPDGDGHQRTHVFGLGIFENITAAEARKALKKLGL